METNADENVAIEMDASWGIEMYRMADVDMGELLPLRTFLTKHACTNALNSIRHPTPETVGTVTGRMHALCITSGLVGHAHVLEEDGTLTPQVCDSVFEFVEPAAFGHRLSKVYESSRTWVPMGPHGVVNPTNAEANDITRLVATAYGNSAPLTVYTNQAVMEAAYHRASPFWSEMYPELEKVSCHYGIFGTLHDNALVSMGRLAGTDREPDVEGRRPHPHHRGFLDACFAPQSTASGCVRLLVAGVGIRMPTDSTFAIVDKITEPIRSARVLRSATAKMWTVKCMGIYTSANEAGVREMLALWAKVRHRDMPTLHIFSSLRLAVISVSMGTLVRPLVVDVLKPDCIGMGPMVDTTIAHGACDTLAMLGMRFPDVASSPDQFFAAGVLTIPYYAWTTEPRLNLGMQMLRQGINLAPVEGEATIVSIHRRRATVTTPFGNMLEQKFGAKRMVSMPHITAVGAFVNLLHNTEDACVVSSTFANSGRLAWRGFIDYPVPNTEPVRGRVDNITSRPWFKPALEAECISVSHSQDGSVHARTVTGALRLMCGDKLATQHGLKFTVGDIMDPEDMVTLEDVQTGERFKVDVLLSTKNMARGLGGQIREMCRATAMFASIRAFREADPNALPVFVTDASDTETAPAILPKARIIDPVTGKVVRMINAAGVEVDMTCSYGLIQILQLRHIASLKAHFPAETPTGIEIPKGRYRSGTPRLGEGEVLAMHMANMPFNIRDAIASADLVTTEVCATCHAMAIFCDCGSGPGDVIKVAVRKGLMVLNTYATLATLNSTDAGMGRWTMRFRCLRSA